MTKLLKIAFLFLIISLSYNSMLTASHCYSYTVKTYFNLVTEGDSIYLQETIKDGNEITYVSQRKIKLEGVTNKDFSIVSSEGRTILFVADGYYYCVEKSIFEVENYGINKLFATTSVSQIVSDCFFLINGNWHYVAPVEFSDQIVDKVLPALKGQIEILANYDRGELLLKDSQKVYVFYTSSASLKPIPKLSATSTRYKESNNFYKEHFLYDNDTFYLTTIRFIYRDITTSFNTFGKYNGFTHSELAVTNKVSLDTNDDLIWMYLSDGKTIDNNTTVYFYPLNANYLNSYKDLYVYNDSIYNNNEEAINKSQPMDVSIVKDLKTFHCDDFGYNYSDSLASYIYNREVNQLTEVSPKTSRMDSLKADSNSNFKPFSLGYTYDDKIVIENIEIENIANKDKLQFIGSTVDVIIACDQVDKMDNWTGVKVLYNYFFKDDCHIYFYQTGQTKLSVLTDILPNEYQIDNYKDIMKLNELAEKLKNNKTIISEASN